MGEPQNKKWKKETLKWRFVHWNHKIYAGEADVLHRDMEQAELHFQTAGDFQRYRGMLLAYMGHIVKASGNEGAAAHFFGKDTIKTVDDILKMTQTEGRYLFLLSDNVRSLYGSETDALRIDLGKAALLFQGRDSFRGYRHIILAYVRYFLKEVNYCTACRFLKARVKREFQEWEKGVNGKP